MRRLSILVLALSFGLPAARAETLPAYDPEVICETIAGSSARQELIMRGCLDLQQRMRKEVALAWDSVPAPVQASCSKSAAASGDYWKLKSCIDREANPSTAAGH